MVAWGHGQFYYGGALTAWNNSCKHLLGFSTAAASLVTAMAHTASSPATSCSTVLPADLQAILDDLDTSDRKARRIAGGLSDAQANWQPSETAWSVGQCLDHLARANTVYTAALLTAVTDPRAERKSRRAPIQPAWFSRRFIRTIEHLLKEDTERPRRSFRLCGQAGRRLCGHFLNRKSRCERSFGEARAWT